MLFKNSMYAIFCIILVSLLLTLFVDVFFLDAVVARLVHDTSSEFGRWVRDYSQYPSFVLSFIFLVSLIKIKQVPLSEDNKKLFKEVSLAWLLTLFIGVLVVINATLKLGAERPRPKVTHILVDDGMHFQKILADGDENTTGKSFPSGHSSMGFLFASPFFILLLRGKYLLSIISISTGLIFGGVIGYGRMILGAHFFMDVYWAGVVVLVSAIISGLIVLYLSEDKNLVISQQTERKLNLALQKVKTSLTFS